MPTIFGVLVVVMSIACAAFLLWPLLAARSGEQGHSSRAVLAGGFLSLLLLGGSYVFYQQNSQWNWLPNGVPDSPVAQQLYELQQKVHEQPDDAIAWRTLGTFYLQFEQLRPAIDALNKALELTNGTDVETNLTLVEALSVRNAEADQARITDLIDLTLRVNPGHRKALWYGGEVAAGQGKFDVAIARWQMLLEESSRLNTPEAQSVTQMIGERIELAKQHMSAPAAAETIQVTVAMAASLSAEVDPATPLFVLVRAQGQRGPPLAVHRTSVSELPLSVSLSDRDAMLPTRKISDFEQVEVVARVALGGTPTAQKGDYFGVRAIGPSDTRSAEIVIDTVQP